MTRSGLHEAIIQTHMVESRKLSRSIGIVKKLPLLHPATVRKDLLREISLEDADHGLFSEEELLAELPDYVIITDPLGIVEMVKPILNSLVSAQGIGFGRCPELHGIGVW